MGARPQFIKAAPVTRALAGIAEEIVVHTGQHYDRSMSQVFFDELRIPPPHWNLEVGSGPHGEQTGRMLERIEGVLLEEDPDVVLVYGDTNSTLAGALAAAKLGIRVAHVEAGLRSGRWDMPEEINRVLTDRLSNQLFCPTETARDHLAREGITEGVHVVGDVMVDALRSVEADLSPARVEALGVEAPYLAATLHRAENTDDPERLRSALALLGSMDLPVALPLHPRTEAALAREGLQLPESVTALRPLGYIVMLSLVANAQALLTDSGGLQKEAAILRTPCLTLRSETEWPETVDAGWNHIVDLDVVRAKAALEATPSRPIDDVFPAGASRRIVDLLLAS